MEREDLRKAVILELQNLVGEGEDIVVVVSDSTSTSKISPFLELYPNRVVNVGIAEQNLVGVATGLSLGGYTVFTANAAPFLTTRSAEQVKNDVCYSRSNVKLLGLNAGVAYGPLASTHHAIDDISMMLGLGNIQVVAPIDIIEVREIIRWSVSYQGPVYIRMDSQPLPIIHSKDYKFVLGQPDLIKEGKDTIIIAMGSVMGDAYEAVQVLKDKGKECGLLNLSSLRPLDKTALLSILKKYSHIVTVEEHSLHGGISEIITKVIVEHNLSCTFSALGIPEGEFSVCGTREEIRAHYGFDTNGIVNTVLQS